MKTRFIVNPISGTGNQKDIEKLIFEEYQNYDLYFTKKSGDASSICEKSLKEDIDIIIAVGGDGTVNECVKSLIYSKIILGIIPCGSGNGFARHIGMSQKIKSAINQLKKGKVSKIDTCSINKIPFINVSGTGFDAHIANKFKNLKKRGFISYIKLVLSELSFNANKYEIIQKNKKHIFNAFFISLANASQYGNNAIISPLSNINDGIFEVIVVEKFTKWLIPIFIFKLFSGKIHTFKYVKIIRCNEITINSKTDLVHVDGETYKTEKKLNIKVNKNSLKILKPNEKK